MPKKPSDKELLEVKMLINSSVNMYEAKMFEFNSALFSQNPELLETARINVLASVEAYLDALIYQGRLKLMMVGLDPDGRE